MKRLLLIRLIPALLLVIASSASASADFGCDDFLSKLADKPSFVEFKGCTQALDRMGQPFSASYEVSGANASKAEQYLEQHFGISPITRACCVWDSTQNGFRDPATGINYLISIGSEETEVRQRESWAKINRFTIQVDAYAEDP
ncbi:MULTISPECIES: DUF4952 domain-containing protein [unclassified Pseudomonas]|uniref:DUF4952 domain-containing protein n=1 Tax=unclassified Pseudomonas TaxID=196821 RepID=UPI000FDE596E|nr:MULTISPECIES: DUF4952 domain-containing protein [unclassified Pseudomonas]AZZ75456.1 DUF4952 domain-containing protein [Pseudomonas sp. RU47]WNZ86250.1 DUF4952 domain-containing protein [Pseudomonas sp. P108]